MGRSETPADLKFLRPGVIGKTPAERRASAVCLGVAGGA
jgi:hypothetical protein